MPNNLIGQRFKVNERVTRKNYSVIANKYSKRYGNITEILERENSLGNKMYYYKVLWSDDRSSEHAQHSLQSVE
tara:strand:+ start:217 stop:438 length:222 start_codon:yes stop_codon:yes gene_type:complete